ncbi:MAG: TetR/AcrR family transcriptional regulator [Pseudohongiella sp.]|nr:TetR/AcrR family transcriptional regulator [Pseudohongiella sp.]MDO9520157.1 TetR/AcrR family transcriptional regulator [Pseudohongiella sp.]MDP2125970.1 TetR/AcrR family transcriptional regulator [Pseudohongiella sp.]
MSANPGRPRGESNARQLLIEAAHRLFTAHSYESVSTRSLAAAAGVDAALIRYYFGSKAGLFEQMLRETLAPVLAGLRENSHGHTADQQPDHSNCRIPERLESLMLTYYRIMAPNPGLARLIQRVLHTEKNTPSYQIVNRVFDDIHTLSRLWIQKMLVDAGHLRPDVDPMMARLSLVSLMVFPLLAPPIFMENSGISLKPGDVERLVKHNVALLQRALFVPEQ